MVFPQVFVWHAQPNYKQPWCSDPQTSSSPQTSSGQLLKNRGLMFFFLPRSTSSAWPIRLDGNLRVGSWHVRRWFGSWMPMLQKLGRYKCTFCRTCNIGAGTRCVGTAENDMLTHVDALRTLCVRFAYALRASDYWLRPFCHKERNAHFQLIASPTSSQVKRHRHERKFVAKALWKKSLKQKIKRVSNRKKLMS